MEKKQASILYISAWLLLFAFGIHHSQNASSHCRLECFKIVKTEKLAPSHFSQSPLADHPGNDSVTECRIADFAHHSSSMINLMVGEEFLLSSSHSFASEESALRLPFLPHLTSFFLYLFSVIISPQAP